MTNDAAVARDFYERLYGMTFRLFLDANGEPDDDNGIELRLAATVGEKALFETSDHSTLVPATVVAELRAELQAARAAVESKAGWEWKARAEAAERRLAELRQALLSVEAALGPNVHLYDTTSDMARALEVATAALTKESP